MTKVQIKDKTFVIDEMIKTMEVKDIINMVALEIEQTANKYQSQKKDRQNRIKALKKAILAIKDVDEIEEAIASLNKKEYHNLKTNAPKSYIDSLWEK